MSNTNNEIIVKADKYFVNIYIYIIFYYYILPTSKNVQSFLTTIQEYRGDL